MNNKHSINNKIIINKFINPKYQLNKYLYNNHSINCQLFITIKDIIMEILVNRNGNMGIMIYLNLNKMMKIIKEGKILILFYLVQVSNNNK